MQKNGGILFAGLLIVLLVCGVVSASDYTVRLDRVPVQNMAAPIYTWGDQLQFDGMNNGAQDMYLSLGEPADNIDWSEPSACRELSWNVRGSARYPIRPIADKSWNYTWDSGSSKCKYPNVNVDIVMQASGPGGDITFPLKMKARSSVTDTPTSTPTTTATPDLLGKIDALNQSLAQQNGTLNDQGVLIDSLNSTIVTQETVLSRHLSSTPTDTPNYAATIAALESRVATQQTTIESQGNLIDRILRFLGLK